MMRSVAKRAIPMSFILVYFFKSMAITSVPLLEAPILKRRADAMAGRAMAKIRSSIGSLDKGFVRGIHFSKNTNKTDKSILA